MNNAKIFLRQIYKLIGTHSLNSMPWGRIATAAQIMIEALRGGGRLFFAAIVARQPMPNTLRQSLRDDSNLTENLWMPMAVQAMSWSVFPPVGAALKWYWLWKQRELCM